MDLYPSNSLQSDSTNLINSRFLVDLQQTSGMDGARSIITRPSSRIAVFDKNDDIVYIISTDTNNNREIRRCRFYDEPEPKPEDIFASKAEMKELKGEIDNVQQSIRELTAVVTNAINTNSSNAAGSETQFNSGSGNGSKKYVSKPKGDIKPSGSYENSISQ